MTLLVVVDMQRDFVTGPLSTSEARVILPAVKALVDGAEQVVYTKDTHSETYLMTQEGRNLPVVHCVKGTEGWEILPELYRAGSPVFEKGTFASLSLAEYARREAFDKIVLCGVCTDICVVSNALLLKAYLPETEIEVVQNACAGVTPASHEAALRTMASCQIKII